MLKLFLNIWGLRGGPGAGAGQNRILEFDSPTPNIVDEELLLGLQQRRYLRSKEGERRKIIPSLTYQRNPQLCCRGERWLGWSWKLGSELWCKDTCTSWTGRLTCNLRAALLALSSQGPFFPQFPQCNVLPPYNAVTLVLMLKNSNMKGKGKVGGQNIVGNGSKRAKIRAKPPTYRMPSS